MNEAAWLADAADPQELLAFVQRKVSERKMRLFACACCRRLAGCDRAPLRDALELVESYADDTVGFEELREMRGRLAKGQFGNRPDKLVRAAVLATAGAKLDAAGVAHLVVQGRAEETGGRALRKQRDANARYRQASLSSPERVANEAADVVRDAERNAQVELLREVIGNPFRAAPVEPAWLNWMFGTVRKLAQAAYDDRDFANLPILADALEEAGCNDEDILDHCRLRGDHVRGCWAIDALLGKA